MSPHDLFRSPGYAARELGHDEVPLVQALFDANPEYFRAVNGRDPNPGEAQIEFDEEPPPHLGWSRLWRIGLYAEGQPRELAGFAGLAADLCAPKVWHIGLFIVATRLHGSGAAAETYRALERWIAAQGAIWLRLGVVVGNTRAERFWARHGFREVRTREGIDTGGRINDVSMRVKPLARGAIDEYLELVPRDRPGSSLP